MENPLTLVPLFLGEGGEERARELSRAMAGSGVTVADAPGSLPACLSLRGKRALVLTDDEAAFAFCLENGISAAPVLTGQGGASFPGAEYLLEDPEEVAPDDFLKIYERAAGLPWTILEGEDWILREFAKEDAPALLRLYDAQALRFLPPPGGSGGEGLEREMDGMIRSCRFYGYGLWALVERESGEIIGRVGIDPSGCAGGPALGYLIRADRRGRGLAVRVLREVLAYARDAVGLTELALVAAPENGASVRVAQRLGFVPECRCGADGYEAPEGAYLRYRKTVL